jgi:hypothetical protein
LPASYIVRSAGCACGSANFMPRDSDEIHATSVSMLACSPRPNGVFAISAASKPCRVCMQVSRRDSRSCTRWVSANQRGKPTNAPFPTPGPRPRSHCCSDAFFGPRGCFQSASPFASHSSAGLPSASIARYFAISSADDCAAAGAPISAAAASAISLLIRCLQDAPGAPDRVFR